MEFGSDYRLHLRNKAGFIHSNLTHPSLAEALGSIQFWRQADTERVEIFYLDNRILVADRSDGWSVRLPLDDE